MKKVLSVVAVVALAASFTACKKEYTCECTWDGGSATYTSGKMKKKDAETWCEGSQSSIVTCELK